MRDRRWGDRGATALGVAGCSAWTSGRGRIGIAMSDSAGTLALPRATIDRSGDADADRRRLVRIAVDEEVGTVVVGLPLSLDGSPGPAASAAREEADKLRHLLEGHGVAVELFDERLTTVSADRALAAGGFRGRARRRRVDETAAAVMLSAWLEAGGGG